MIFPMQVLTCFATIVHDGALTAAQTARFIADHAIFLIGRWPSIGVDIGGFCRGRYGSRGIESMVAFGKSMRSRFLDIIRIYIVGDVVDDIHMRGNDARVRGIEIHRQHTLQLTGAI